MARLTVINVSPGIVRLDEKVVVVQHCKAIHNMGAEAHIYVFRYILALALPIPRPVGEVADHLEPI